MIHKPYSRPFFLFCCLLLLAACNSAPSPEKNGPETKESEIVERDSVPEVKEPREETANPPEEALAAIEAPPEEKKEEPKEDPPEKKIPKKRPKISFAATTYDYGVIMQGDKVEHQFQFKNKGDAELLIKNVTASCGCTQPTYPFIPIPPGEEGSIGVVFDSKGKLGRQKPTITVVTNARPSTHKLYLEGFVDAERAKEPVQPDSTESAKEEKEGLH